MEFEELGIQTRSGQSRYATICPECNDKREKHRGARCLTVNDEPGNRWYNCHHCGWSGNLDVAGKYDRVREESKMPNVQRTYTMDARAYLDKRGISLNTAKKLRIYEQTRGKQTILAFPFFMNLTLVNVKYLNTAWKKGDKGPKWWQLSKDIGTRILPWNMQNIKTHDDTGNRFQKNILIVTEGEWDAATWVEAGYNNVISVPQGAPSLKAKDFKEEFAYWQDPYVKAKLEDIDLIYLSCDNDQAGVKLRGILAMILGKDKCRYIKYPTGYKDINEVLMGHEEKKLAPLGKKGVDECLDEATSIPVAGVMKASQVWDELQVLRNDGFQPGLGCGVEEVDRLFTVKPKHITFVTGVPGSGKSVWIRWWLVEMIKHNKDLDLKWAMFTPENRPVSREYAKIAEALTGYGFHKDGPNAMNDDQMRKAMRFTEKHFFLISPDRSNYESFGGQIDASKVNTLGALQQYLIYLKKTENIYGYVIDAWNKIEHEQPKWQTETAFISEQLDHLINFNTFWDLHGIVIVHPKKIEQVGENYKMPSLYDIKGSSAWKEKADIGILVHRYKMKKITAKMAMERGIDLGDLDEDEKWEVVRKAPTIIRTEKIRFEETGVEDRVKMEMTKWGQFSVVESKVKPLPEKPMPDPDNRIEAGSTLWDDDGEDDLPF